MDSCPRRDRAYCHNCQNTIHMTKACRQSQSVKKARSLSTDKNRKSRSRSNGERSKYSSKLSFRRAPTPKRSNRYQSVAKEASATKTDSEPDESHRQVQERSSSSDSDSNSRKSTKSDTRRRVPNLRIRCRARRAESTDSVKETY